MWDECTMAHKLSLEALETSLKDIRDDTQPYGGVTLLLAGDFRQTLPVILRDTPADEISACLKSSHLWPKFIAMKLRTNIRVHIHGTSSLFSELLLSVGNGQLPESETGEIYISYSLGHSVQSLRDLREHVYPGLQVNIFSNQWLCERVILAPLNEMVRDTNAILLRVTVSP